MLSITPHKITNKMNKVFQINLGGTPFTIDEDAYEHLSAYLEALHHHFRGTDGYAEITADIEARLAELFSESAGARSIVNNDDVRDAIAVMGRPEDFGAEPLMDDIGTQGREREYRTGKRLFRDGEDKKVGGVCAGISAYFGISDPIWIRVFFAIVILSGGVGLPLYIILWALMPEAKTAGDRLAMRGEPINVDNITRIVREEFDNISEKVTELSEEWSGKKKAKATAKAAPADTAHFAADTAAEPDYTEPVYSEPHYRERERHYGPRQRSVLERIVRGVVMLFVIFLIIWLAIVWFAIIIGAFVSFPYLEYVFPGQESLTVLGMFNSLFLIGIPVAAVVMLLSKMLFRSRIAPAWRWGLAAFWFLNVVSFATVGSQLARNFFADADRQENMPTEQFVADTLRLSSFEPMRGNETPIFGGDVEVGDGVFRAHDLLININHSPDGEWRLVKHTYSRGATYQDAQLNAGLIVTPLQTATGSLALPTAYELRNKTGYRGQSVWFELQVPTGKVLVFDPSFYTVLGSTDLMNREERPHRSNGQVWRMEAEGLSCISCGEQEEQEKQEDQQLGFSDFSKLDIRGKVKIMIDRDDAYSLRVTGSKTEVDALQVIQKDGLLTVIGPMKKGQSPVRLFLRLPDLGQLDLYETDDVLLRGFKQEELVINATGDFEIKSYTDIQKLDVRLSDRCELEWRGKVDLLRATLTDRARFDGELADIGTATIDKSDDVKIGLPPSTRFL